MRLFLHGRSLGPSRAASASSSRASRAAVGGPLFPPCLLAVAALLVAAALAAPAAGQEVIRNDEDLAFDRPEAWAMQYFASTTLLTGFGVPERREPGAVELGLELGWIPELDGGERRIGFGGTKEEDVNKAPLLARLRGTVALPEGLSLTVGYVPPVEVFDVEAHLLAVSLGRPFHEGRSWRLGGRFLAQWGEIRSDITCPSSVAGRDDLAANPSGCDEPSRDEMTLRYAGFELSAGRDDAGPWSPYAALSVQHMDLAFQVDALTFGVRDRSLLTADGWTWAATAGVDYRPGGGRPGSAPGLTVEAFYTPLEVDRSGDGRRRTDALLNLRALLTYRLR